MLEKLIRKLTASWDNDYLYKTIDDKWPGKPTMYMLTISEEERLFLKQLLKDQTK